MKVCTNCNKTYDDSSQFCVDCGQPLTTVEGDLHAQEAEAVPAGNNPLNKTLIIVIAALVIIILILLLSGKKGPSSDVATDTPETVYDNETNIDENRQTASMLFSAMLDSWADPDCYDDTAKYNDSWKSQPVEIKKGNLGGAEFEQAIEDAVGDLNEIKVLGFEIPDDVSDPLLQGGQVADNSSFWACIDINSNYVLIYVKTDLSGDTAKAVDGTPLQGFVEIYPSKAISN